MKDRFYNALIKERIDVDRNKRRVERWQVGLCPLHKIWVYRIGSRTKRAFWHEGVAVIHNARFLEIGLRVVILRTNLKGRGDITANVRETQPARKNRQKQKN